MAHTATRRIGEFEVILADDFGHKQDEEYFYIKRSSEWELVRFHDYATIYEIPGLYDWLFYETLACQSQHTVAHALQEGADSHMITASPAELRVLDLGAGNGIIGQQLRDLGARTVLGIDILDEAAHAASRDHPGVYTDYLVADLTHMTASQQDRIERFQPNLMVCVAALGFGDIPVPAFNRAVDLLEADAWLIFNIKDAFLTDGHPSGFSQMISSAVDTGALQLLRSTQTLHRTTVTGSPLHYTCITARKTPIWQEFSTTVGRAPRIE